MQFQPERSGGGYARGVSPAPTSQTWAVGGLLAVILYVGTTVIGGLVVPGYSHIGDPISQLTAPSTPHRGWWALGYVAYNLAVALFATGFWKLAPRSWPLRTASVLLVAGAVAGVAQVTAFPQDDGRDPVTTAGTLHLWLAGVSALTTVVVCVLCGVGLRHLEGWRAVSTLSYAVAAAILVSGGIAAALVASTSMGLFERVPIGLFLAWIVAVALHRLLKLSAPAVIHA